jgi:hypothetical protein
MIQNATEVRLIIHLLKYLKNNADLEAKLISCIISLKIFRIVAFLLQKEWNKKTEVDFEKWLKVMIFHCPFKILEKSLYEAVEVVITKFLSPNLAKGGAYVQYFLDIVLERDVRKPGRNSRF